VPTPSPATKPAALAPPTLVSLDLRNALLADAGRALSEQAISRQLIVPVEDAPTKAAPLVTLRVEREPYLVALTKLCAAAGVEPSGEDPSRLWLRRAEGAPAPADESRLRGPAFVSGPFLVIAQGVTAKRFAHAVNPGPDPIPDLQFDLIVLAEPRVRVIERSPWVRVTEATDETGSILGGELPRPPEYMQWYSQHEPVGPSVTFSASLGAARPVGRRIASLKGAINLKVVTAYEIVRIDDVNVAWNGLRVRGDAVSSTALSPRGQTGAGMDLVIHRDKEDDQAWQRFAQWARASLFAITDAQGRPMPQYGFDHPQNKGRELVVPVHFRRTGNLPDGTQIGPPVALEWLFPSEVKEVQIPFEFKDLPLP
jgi:hypothetical protein